jgi:hypothetical protein
MEFPDYAPPFPLRFNDAKLPCQMRRLREANLEINVTVSTLDSPSTIYAAVRAAVEAHVRQHDITLPPPPDPSDTRCTFGVLAPMNTPRNGSAMRIYNFLSDSDRSEWWTLGNILKIFRKGYTVPGAEELDSYIFLCMLLLTLFHSCSLLPIFVGPRYGMISIVGHFCITMRITYNLDDESSSIEDCPPTMHLEACPTSQAEPIHSVPSTTVILGRRERSESLTMEV